uniref:Uncharacterized protein n=1 Tax=Escherichia coli TaxID=562 RepID=A0A890DG42_ECOLX|nr:hypothetical protein [Escherichia coli]
MLSLCLHTVSSLLCEVAATIKHDCYCHQLILFVPSGNATHGLYQNHGSLAAAN